mgnify:CR=1 FL=1
MLRKIYDAIIIATGEPIYVHKERDGSYSLKTSREHRKFKPSELIIKHEKRQEHHTELDSE